MQVYSQRKSKFFKCVITAPDGTRHHISTRRSERKQATLMALILQLECEAAHEVGVTDEDRRMLSDAVDSLFNILTRNKAPRQTIKQILQKALDEACQANDAGGKYAIIFAGFCDILGPDADLWARQFKIKHMLNYVESLQKQYKYSSAKGNLRFIKRLLKNTASHHAITDLELTHLSISRGSCIPPDGKDRSFMTDEELQAVYKFLDQKIDENWNDDRKRRLYRQLYGLIVAGENFGPRLVDMRRLRLHHCQLNSDLVSFLSSKKEKLQTVPMLESFKNFLQDSKKIGDLETGDNPRIFDLLVKKDKAWLALKNVFIASGVRTPQRPVTYNFIRRRIATVIAQEDIIAARDTMGHSNVATTNIYVRTVTDKSVAKGFAISQKHSIAEKHYNENLGGAL